MPSSQPLLDPQKISRLGHLELVARQVVEGFLRGLHRSPFKGSSVEFAEYRPYVPGDETAHLDWRAYGKTDRLYLKEYEDETNLRTMLMVDASQSMAFGSLETSKFRYASCLAASLGLLMIHQLDAVGLITFSDGIGRLVPPKRSMVHFQGLLGELEKTSPGGETRLGSVLRKAAEAIRRRGLVVLFSDLFSDPRDLLHGLARLKAQGSEVLVFQIVDPMEREFPFSRWTHFRDAENPARRLKVDARWVREVYLKNLNAHLELLRQGCHSMSIDYQLIDTRTPFDTALANYLATRRKRGLG